MTKRIAAPAISTITFDAAVSLFGEQVRCKAAPGQRNHEGQNKNGRMHITGFPDVPSTQAVLQAVRVGTEEPLLIDGYHRMLNWMDSEQGCPFEFLILISHEMTAQETKEARINTIDQLAQSIDNRKAVKTNADRWYGVMRQVGFKPKSKAYALGQDANLYLKFALGKANDSLVELTEAFLAQQEIHTRMDALFEFAESHIPTPARRSYFNSAVAYAICEGLKIAGPKQDALVKTVRSALLLAAGYSWQNPPRQVEDLARYLKWLASGKVKEEINSYEHRGDRVRAVKALLAKPMVQLIDQL